MSYLCLMYCHFSRGGRASTRCASYPPAPRMMWLHGAISLFHQLHTIDTWLGDASGPRGTLGCSTDGVSSLVSLDVSWGGGGAQGQVPVVKAAWGLVGSLVLSAASLPSFCRLRMRYRGGWGGGVTP